MLGSCQVSIFDESYLLRQGPRELVLWPFQKYARHMVCQGEYSGTTEPLLTLSVAFETFPSPVWWRLADPSKQQSKPTQVNSRTKASISTVSTVDCQTSLDEETTNLK